MKKENILLVSIMIFVLSICLIGCNKKSEDPVGPTVIEHDCYENESDWQFEDENIKCGEKGTQIKVCTICGAILDTKEAYKRHEYQYQTIEATCDEDGKYIETCKYCDYYYESKIPATGHKDAKYVITKEASKDGIGVKSKVCSACGKTLEEKNYANNGWLAHGKLSVKGTDLVDENGDKFQLYGVSTHGLQWYGYYVTYDTLSELNLAFGNNVMRFSLYSAEGGYCECDDTTRQVLLQRVIDGVNIATELGIYAVIDWHMLGAEDENDENPLYYMDQAKEFFTYISGYFKDNVNVLYEIMNEPSGSATWADCKKYAEEVIPCIRANSDGVILVGNPHWTSDLASVYKDPLKGYKNIMYTYHFYADDITSSSDVVTYYAKGLPIFISEFGFMDSDGDGALNYTSGNAWIKALDDRNISYIAWNLSSGYSTSGILKTNTNAATDFSDSNLKEWGIVLKNMYRSKSGLDKAN